MSVSAEPASILGINAGGLAIGDIADVCIFDPDKQWQINSETWQALEHDVELFGDKAFQEPSNNK